MDESQTFFCTPKADQPSEILEPGKVTTGCSVIALPALYNFLIIRSWLSLLLLAVSKDIHSHWRDTCLAFSGVVWKYSRVVHGSTRLPAPFEVKRIADCAY